MKRPLLLATALSFAGGLVRAEPEPPIEDPAGVVARQCQSANALSAIACEIRVQIPSELGQLAVASAPLAAPDAGRLDELTKRLVHVVAGRFDSALELGTLSLAAARARPTQATHLLHLTPRINGAHFEVTADLYGVPRGFWDRFKAPPGPLHHVFAARRVDGEVGSFLPVPKLLGQLQGKAPLPIESVTALSCADVDGDRALDLVVNGRRDVYLGRIVEGRFAPEKQASWHELSPVAPAPLKQPIAAVHVEPGRGLSLGSSDRRDLVLLGSDLGALAIAPGKLPWGDLGCAERAGLGLAPRVVDCSGDRVWERLERATELDTIAGGTFETKTGTTRVLVTRAVGQSVLELVDGEGRRARLPEAGAQAALSDLDRDGVLEIASSKNTLDPEKDALRVHSWKPEGLELVYEIAVPTGIDAVATCPSEDLRAALVVVATAGELWFVR